MKNERVSLAQELHDGIAQDLVALGFSIDALIAGEKSPETKGALRHIRFTITDLIEKVRRDIHALRTNTEPMDTLSDTNVTYELQRVFLEILRNVQMHSQASMLTLEVRDNGIGGAQEKLGSFGLAGIQERTQKLNGEIHIDSNEEGTKIRIQIPLDR